MSEYILNKEHDYKNLFNFELVSKIIEGLVTVTNQSSRKIDNLIDNDRERDNIITK
jgi:hypothetical protein